MPVLRVCIDRRPPPKTDRERLALVKDAKWQPGDVIRAMFMDGDPVIQQKVEQVAQTWMAYADLVLYFGDDPEADIRISFLERGSWSYIGTECHQIPHGRPTMNYGWLTRDISDDEVSQYPIPREFTLDGFAVELHATLSEMDKEFIRQQYT